MIFNILDRGEQGIVADAIVGLRTKGRLIGLTSGTFDLIHPHHLNYLVSCRRECDELIVGVDSDALVRKIKGPERPLIYDFARALMVDALKPVTFTFVMSDVTDFGAVAALVRPDYIFRNNEFLGREGEVVGREYAREVRIIRDIVSLTSTTEIVRAAAKAGQPLER